MEKSISLKDRFDPRLNSLYRQAYEYCSLLADEDAYWKHASDAERFLDAFLTVYPDRPKRVEANFACTNLLTVLAGEFFVVPSAGDDRGKVEDRLTEFTESYSYTPQSFTSHAFLFNVPPHYILGLIILALSSNGEGGVTLEVYMDDVLLLTGQTFVVGYTLSRQGVGRMSAAEMFAVWSAGANPGTYEIPFLYQEMMDSPELPIETFTATDNPDAE